MCGKSPWLMQATPTDAETKAQRRRVTCSGHTALGVLLPNHGPSPFTRLASQPAGQPRSPRPWSPSWPVLFYILSYEEEGDISDVGLTPNLRGVG